jgi:hypothetical protein
MTDERTYQLQLAMEAAVTGLTVLPVAAVTRRLVPNNFYVQVALAGAAYHLISEAMGVNEWFIYHSAAALHNAMAFSRRQQKIGLQQQKVCRLLVPRRSSSLVLWRGSPGKSNTPSLVVK